MLVSNSLETRGFWISDDPKEASRHDVCAAFSTSCAADSEDEHSAGASSSQGSEETEHKLEAERHWSGQTALKVALRVGFLAWMGIGMLVLVLGVPTDVVTALYVLVQIITSVGYGDAVDLVGRPMRGFMSVYVFFGNMLTALVVTEHVRQAAARTHKVMKRHRVTKTVAEQSRRMGRPLEAPAVESGFLDSIKKHAHLLSAFAWLACMVVLGTVFFGVFDFCKCPREWHGDCLQTLEDCEQAGGSARSWVDALYMSVVTFTTVGFGDEHPNTWTGRLFGIFWISAGVASMAHLLTELAHTVMVHGMHESQEDLTDDMAELTGKDHTGSVTKFEFVAYMLVKTGLVSTEDLLTLTGEFDHFDQDGDGELSWWEVAGDGDGT